MTKPKPAPEYRFLEIKCVRGFENRTISKWEADGWEYLSQDSGKFQSTLKFRKEKGKLDSKTLAAIGLGAILVLLISVIGITTGFKDSPETTPAPVASESSEPTAEATPEPEETVAEPEVEKTPEVTLEQVNAIEKAMNYLNFSAFSRKGLINQLKFEGFSKADSTYAVDSLGVDWNNEAARKAQEYLNFQSFSRSGLIKQLVFEGFSTAQAKYGVKQVGL
jgi:hypothetical protein